MLPAVISVPCGDFYELALDAGKSALIKMLMKEHGFSKRKSEKAVNAVFDCMARALRRGEEVELPIGWIQTARPPAKRKKVKWQRFRNIQINRKSQTKEIFSKIVTYPDKIIRFRANPELIVKGPGPPPPLSPEVINKGEELEQLLSRLGFPDVTGCGRGIAARRRRRESGLVAVPLADLGQGRTAYSPTTWTSVPPSNSCIGSASRRRNHAQSAIM